MSAWSLVAAALVYLIGLLAMAPATLIDARLRDATGGRLRLAEARGTIWSGSGRLEFRDASRQSGIAKHLGWRVRPAHLLRGRLRCEVSFDHAPRHFSVTLTPSAFEVAEADLSLPAATLGLAEPRLAALELTGDVLLHVDRLAIASEATQGHALLQWRSAGSTLTPVSPLGDYELRLEGDGAVIRGSLRTLRGPLQLEGLGSWTPGRTPDFRGTAVVPPQHQQQLSPLLRLIAVERGGGSFALQLK